MPDPQQERMDALTAANVRMLRRLDELESRIRQLEATSGSGAVDEPEAPPVESWTEPIPATPPRTPTEIPETSSAPAHERRPSSFDEAETAVGLNWVNRIGALTLIIGAAFFFKYAMDNEWIGPTGRVLLGLLAGSGVCAFGFRSWLRGHSIFAQGVSAAGLAMLYLSIWASYSLYHLIAPALAFTVMLAITLLSGALAWRFDALAMAALGIAGGYFTPVLLSSGEYRPWFFSSYIFMLNAGWLYLARQRGWKRLELLTAGLTALIGYDFLQSLQPADQGPVGTFCLFSQYAVFVTSPYWWLVYVAQALGGFGGALAWENEVWRAGFVLIAVLCSGLIVAGWKRYRPLPLIAWAGFTAGFAYLFETYARPAPVGPLFLVASTGFAIAFSYIAYRLPARQESPGRFELLMLVVPGLCYFLEGFQLLSRDYVAWRGLFSAALSAVYLSTGWWLWSRQPEDARDNRPVLFCAGAALSLITIAIALQFSGFRITMLWALEAAALAWLSARYQVPQLRIPVALLSVFVLIRLAAVDADAFREPNTLSLLTNVRFLTFFVSAAALGFAAWFLRAGLFALVPYLAAHAALLLGLALENYSWVLRTTPPERQASSISLGLTVLGALYGLALVIAGVISRTRLNRLLGLGLLAVVVLKLYLADVWTMDRLSRILAFGALGLLLLATSFFYSRFRARIEAWMTDDPAHNA